MIALAMKSIQVAGARRLTAGSKEVTRGGV